MDMRNPDKIREAYCPVCHIYVQSNLINPFHQCGTRLISVVKSALTGKRWTGAKNANS